MRQKIQVLLSTVMLLCVFASVSKGLAFTESRLDPECQGDGCNQVTITWDETKQQYKVQNNSADRWVKVEASNLVASSSLCVGPTKSDHLSLSTVVGAFRANLAEESCGRKP